MIVAINTFLFDVWQVVLLNEAMPNISNPLQRKFDDKIILPGRFSIMKWNVLATAYGLFPILNTMGNNASYNSVEYFL